MAGPDYVVIGEIVKARGLRGEVVVKSLTDVEGRFEALESAYVGDEGEERTLYTVEHTRRHREMYLVKFASIDDRLAARERLVGRLVEIPRAASPPAGEETNYYYELIGLEVCREDGPRLGKLEQIIETGANDVYVVRTDAGDEVLLPATREVIVGVDLDAGRMTFRAIPGLLDDGA
ncbi:MAG: ribosome maturation factor RimM [Candidatus Eiseniibacteriota bacterium]|jgi:16S rRNA processing protein RimM